MFSVYCTHTLIIGIIGNRVYTLKVSGRNYADTQAADINSIKQDMHQLMSRVVCGFGVRKGSSENLRSKENINGTRGFGWVNERK